MPPPKRSRTSLDASALGSTLSFQSSGRGVASEPTAKTGSKPKKNLSAPRRGAPTSKLLRLFHTYGEYREEIDKYIHKKWIKRAAKSLVILALLSSAALTAFKLCPKPVQAAIVHFIEDAAILCGRPPREQILKAPIVDDFHDPKPDSWIGGADWPLTKTAGSLKTDRMVISDSQVARWKASSPFEGIYDFHESFTIYIEDPDLQKSADWAVRIQHSWLGLSYYRFSMKFPPKGDATAKVTMTLIPGSASFFKSPC